MFREPTKNYENIVFPMNTKINGDRLYISENTLYELNT